MKLKINNVRIALRKERSMKEAVAKKLGVSVNAIGEIKLLRKAVDARKKNDICLNHHVLADVDVASKFIKRLTSDRDVTTYVETVPLNPQIGELPINGQPIVIGAGPAGLMAALELAKYGYKPILLERGKKVTDRVKDVEHFWQTGEFNPFSNVQFGEGGAGTFSDGKLTTRVTDPVMGDILKTFVECGAPESILWEHKPHVGTDKLRAMVTGLGNKIRALGGEIRYEAHVIDFIIEHGKVSGVILSNGEKLQAGAVVLACGHSARDTYAMLKKNGIGITAKDFAIGVRIEHPQELIDAAQYGEFAGHHLLGAADYMLVYHTPDKSRSLYSFCMCPGGQVVAAASEAGGVVVNGMSMFNRDSGVANAAMVVTVGTKDFGFDPLAGVEFQRQYEKLAYAAGGNNYLAPAQNFDSFLKGTVPSLQSLVSGTYRPGLIAHKLHDVLPKYVSDTLALGIDNFGRKLHGFNDGGALLTGIETRTSAPLRIDRDRNSYTSVTHDLLYPCGEGAGYAGGIMSAALDGYHVAQAIIRRFKPFN